MSIFDLTRELEDFSDQRLMQETQQPSGQYPPYLVVTEIQRRRDLRQRFNADKQKQVLGQPSIAEQRVMEMLNMKPMGQPQQPQGGPQGAPMPQGGQPQPQQPQMPQAGQQAPQPQMQGARPQQMPQQGQGIRAFARGGLVGRNDGLPDLPEAEVLRAIRAASGRDPEDMLSRMGRPNEAIMSQIIQQAYQGNTPSGERPMGSARDAVEAYISQHPEFQQGPPQMPSIYGIDARSAIDPIRTPTRFSGPGSVLSEGLARGTGRANEIVDSIAASNRADLALDGRLVGQSVGIDSLIGDGGAYPNIRAMVGGIPVLDESERAKAISAMGGLNFDDSGIDYHHAVGSAGGTGNPVLNLIPGARHNYGLTESQHAAVEDATTSLNESNVLGSMFGEMGSVERPELIDAIGILDNLRGEMGGKYDEARGYIDEYARQREGVRDTMSEFGNRRRDARSEYIGDLESRMRHDPSDLERELEEARLTPQQRDRRNSALALSRLAEGIASLDRGDIGRSLGGAAREVMAQNDSFDQRDLELSRQIAALEDARRVENNMLSDRVHSTRIEGLTDEQNVAVQEAADLAQIAQLLTNTATNEAGSIGSLAGSYANAAASGNSALVSMYGTDMNAELGRMNIQARMAEIQSEIQRTLRGNVELSDIRQIVSHLSERADALQKQADDQLAIRMSPDPAATTARIEQQLATVRDELSRYTALMNMMSGLGSAPSAAPAGGSNIRTLDGQGITNIRSGIGN